ncbi:DUF1835 domain-containing protein [Thalassotalea ganghwensis]
MTTFHILNGDSLYHRWPSSLGKNTIIMRECLIDGDLSGDINDDHLVEFYKTRANFLSRYPQVTEQEYLERSVEQINRIRAIPVDANICCWFEHDLFCQTNFWFVVRLLAKYHHLSNVYFIGPSLGNEYSFAHMSNIELVERYQSKQFITAQERADIGKLWDAYQNKQLKNMLLCANRLTQKFSFILAAVNAHLARQPDETGLGYPERQLLNIMKELNSVYFPEVFKEFTRRTAIYSFGDLQVKAMFDRLLASHIDSKG